MVILLLVFGQKLEGLSEIRMLCFLVYFGSAKGFCISYSIWRRSKKVADNSQRGRLQWKPKESEAGPMKLCVSNCYLKTGIGKEKVYSHHPSPVVPRLMV